jgi:tetratricopeptide (TPR) repeat protein
MEIAVEKTRSFGGHVDALAATRLVAIFGLEPMEDVARYAAAAAMAEEWPKALEYFLMAARKAAQAFAIREALALYDQALEAAGHLDGLADRNTIIEVHRAKSTLHFVVSEFDRARAEAEQGRQVARQLGDRIREAKALSRMAWAAVWQRDLEGAVANAQAAIRVAGPIGNDEVLARAYFTIGYVRSGTGALAEAREAIGHAINSGRSSGNPAYSSLSLSMAGQLQNWEGDYRGASELQAEALELARQHNHLVPLLFGLFYYGLTLAGQGQYARALGLFREGVMLAERIGDEVIHHSRLLNCLGWLHLELGDFDGAIESSRRSAELVTRGRHYRTHRNAEITLGNIYLAKGDLVQAAEYLESAYKIWDRPASSPWMEWRYSMRLFDSLGRLWLARGEPPRARGLADKCLEIATRTHSRKNLVKAWRLRGSIALAHRDVGEAESALGQALAMARAIGNPTQLWKTELAWGELCAVRHRPDEASDAYRAARAVVERLKAGLQDPRLRTTLEQAPGVPQVYERAGSP